MMHDRSPSGHAPWRAVIGAGAAVAVIAGAAWLVRTRAAGHAGAGDQDAETATAISPPNRLRPVRGPLGDEAAVALDVAMQQRVGIVARPLAAATGAEHTRLMGELVPDPAGVTVIQAPLPGRLSADGGWPMLGAHVAAGTALGRVSDARPLVAPRGGIVTRVAAQPGEMVQAGQELLRLTDFSRPIARVVWGAGAPASAPATVDVAPFPENGAHTARAGLVGLAPEVDSVTRLPVYLYRLDSTWPGARPGAPIVALVAGPTTRGTLVPTSAVVQWQGLGWVYVRRGPGDFVRTRVDTSHPVPGGWLVTPETAGVAPGDTVVVEGAQLLLSEEFRSRVSVGEDEDKQ